jgi:uncharacterized membrane protein
MNWLVWALLHEKLSWHQWVGGGLVVAGAVLLASK